MNTLELLQQKLQEKASMQLAQSHLNKLYLRIGEAYQKIDQLGWIAEEEYKDVHKLENLSLDRLFLKFLGNVEQQLEIERQEYLEAILNLREAQESVKLMEFEKKVLEEKLEKFPKLQEEIDVLVTLREREITATNHPLRNEIIGLNIAYDGCIILNREIYEAKIEGAKVKLNIDKVIKDLRWLREKESWSAAITPNSSQRKIFSRIHSQFLDLKMNLYRFEDELKDIYKYKKINLSHELDQLPMMTQSFYSNLISDWILRQKIYHSLFQFEAILDRVNRLFQSLNYEEKRNKSRMEALEKEKRELIIDSSNPN